MIETVSLPESSAIANARRTVPTGMSIDSPSTVVYNIEIVHRAGKDYVNAAGLPRIPDPLVWCNYYSYGCDVQDLLCGGCKYCVRASEQWDRFHKEVDGIVLLAVRQISHDESDIEPHEDVTWVESIRHKIQGRYNWRMKQRLRSSDG